MAHAPKDQVEAAYARVKFREKRQEVMQAWADYLDQLKQGRTEPAPIAKREQGSVDLSMDVQPVAVRPTAEGDGERTSFLRGQNLSQRHKPWLSDKVVQKVVDIPVDGERVEPVTAVGGTETRVVSLPQGEGFSKRDKPWLRRRS